MGVSSGWGSSEEHGPSGQRSGPSPPAHSLVPPAHSLVPRRNEEEEAEELEETAQEKKLRLAKLYLEQLKQQGEPVDWAGEGRGLCLSLPAVAPATWWVTDAGSRWAAGAAAAGGPVGGWLGALMDLLGWARPSGGFRLI